VTLGELTCRRMEQRDLAAVMRLAHRADEIQTGTSAPQFWSEDILVRWADSEMGVLLVCEVSGELAGFIISSYNPISRDGYLHCVVVSPEHRRAGVGATLMEMTESTLVARGCNHIFGLVKPNNVPSEGLLARCGFKKGQEFTYWQKSVNPAR
jgi:ribosomal protein S18 acetylase RimI-like enzyme